LRLAYAFNHEEAARAFRMAQKIDPGCAMCYWGEALVLGPNINMPMDPEAIAPAVTASRKAVALIKQAAPREQTLIRALATRYSPDPNAERATLDAAYADAMRKVAARFPADENIGVLFAESLMDLSPWDYWEAGGARPKGHTAELVATLERVLKANPNHPGAIHYYIHTVEASTDPKRAEPHAERLGKLMPGAGHVVHMPSHIYYRVGRYKDSLAANRQAVAVDEAYIADQKPAGVYPLAYYPHNVHFVLVSAQMAGDGKTVVAAADKLAGLISDDTARAFAIAQPVKAAPYFAHAQFSVPETVLAMPSPGSDLPYVEGLWHYARGVAFVARGDMDNAGKEQAAIERLAQAGDFSALTTAGIPANEVLQIASHVLQARIAQGDGKLGAAADNFRKAAQLQDQLAYMEPPFWYYPVQQSLGAVLLQQGDLDGAEQAFRASLARTPNNGWALYGLSKVYKQRGDTQRAAAAEELLGKAWAGDRAQLDLARL
jgi:tetratricopeptide (TPR) repeat protein